MFLTDCNNDFVLRVLDLCVHLEFKKTQILDWNIYYEIFCNHSFLLTPVLNSFFNGFCLLDNKDIDRDQSTHAGAIYYVVCINRFYTICYSFN